MSFDGKIVWNYADISTRLEERYWPRWEATGRDLANATWLLLSLKKGGATAGSQTPEWFKELIYGRLKALLNLFFAAEDEIILFPEVNEGLSMVAQRKSGFSRNSPRPEKISKKILGQRDFFGNGPLAEKALLLLARSEMRRLGSWVIEIENEDGIFFVMPNERFKEALLEMGMPPEQVDKIVLADEILFGVSI